MHPTIIWLMSVAWPLEDQAYAKLTEAQREEWNQFYRSIPKRQYHPCAQTCWY